jgi:hypothetical protein
MNVDYFIIDGEKFILKLHERDKIYVHIDISGSWKLVFKEK